MCSTKWTILRIYAVVVVENLWLNSVDNVGHTSDWVEARDPTPIPRNSWILRRSPQSTANIFREASIG